MGKKEWGILAVGIALGLVFSPQFRKLPIVSKLPVA